MSRWMDKCVCVFLNVSRTSWSVSNESERYSLLKSASALECIWKSNKQTKLECTSHLPHRWAISLNSIVICVQCWDQRQSLEYRDILMRWHCKLARLHSRHRCSIFLKWPFFFVSNDDPSRPRYDRFSAHNFVSKSSEKCGLFFACCVACVLREYVDLSLN